MAVTGPWRSCLALRGDTNPLEELREISGVIGGTRVLNGIGEHRFQIPTFDAKAALLDTAPYEIWQYREDVCWWKGPITQIALDGPLTSVGARDLGWYFARRNVGPVEQQFLLDPDFTDGGGDWTAVGCTFTVDSDYRIRGPQTAKLVNATPDADAYIWQSYEAPLNTVSGTIFNTAYHFQLVDFDGPAFEERGLYVVTFDDSDVEVDRRVIPIRASDTVGEWHRIEVESGVIPQGATDWHVQVQLYAVDGEIRWGGGSATVDEHIFSDVGGSDAAEMVNRLATYAQTSVFKSDLGIAIDTPDSGVLVERAYYHAQHGNVWALMSEFPGSNICDIGITPVDETLRTWSPRRGSLKEELAITNADLRTLRWTKDAERAGTAVRVLGQGDGPDREIGWATDAGEMNDLILDLVQSAPQEVTLDGLQALAEAELDRTKRAMAIPTPVVAAQRWVEGGLAEGDTIPVEIDYGPASVSGVFRVVQIDPDPQTDTLALTLNVP